MGKETMAAPIANSPARGPLSTAISHTPPPMTVDQFRASLAETAPPPGIPPALVALWHDGRGDWDEAHRVAQDVHDATGARVHAYLHRKEGDEANAHYWYRRARTAPFVGSLDDEWRAIAEALLSV
jgi:hypothetical protein